MLHVVDLDGARSGAPVNLEHVRRIVAGVEVPVQVGGGLRSAEAVRAVLEAGAARAVLGTAALRDIDFLDQALADHGDRIVVSVDARRGLLATAGWTEQTEVPAESAIEALGHRGASRFVYSSIERDGMLSGPDLRRGHADRPGGARLVHLLRRRLVAGAICGALAALRQVNLTGVIVGTALYEERFGVADAQAALDG